MTYTSIIYEPGEKTHRDENFPVASYLIAKEHRAPIFAFYRFARAADDIADDPHLASHEKITLLDQFEATLLGKDELVDDARPLREMLRYCELSARHPQDLLIAFRQDAYKNRYETWEELVGYCMYSAAPVGRFVLEIHGENSACWPASDALCNALQIINHIQDCKADYKALNRIYIPQDMLARHQVKQDDLAADRASPDLHDCIKELVSKTQTLVASSHLSSHIRNRRLRAEVLAIEKIAHALLTRLRTHDPLSERVHLTKMEYASIIIRAVLGAYV